MIKRVGNYEVLHEVVEHNGILYLSGIVAEDTTRGMGDQTTEALTALAALLEANGSGVDRILQITIFITDMKLKPEMNRAWRAFFNNPEHLPARATLGIAALEEGELIEIVTTAAIR
jgi:enamine deaminase RidA (YjgF/YER057c/UK114 family)